MKFPFQSQHDEMDCGPSCLKMVTDYYGQRYTLEYLREISYLNRNGVSLLSLNDAAENIGFKTMMVFTTIGNLIRNHTLPCILHWNQHHFVVLYKVKVLKNKDVIFTIADPRHGVVKVDLKTFESSWIAVSPDKGTALMLEPTAMFYDRDPDNTHSKKSFRFLLNYIRPHKKYLLQLLAGLLAVSMINLIFPFLTQLLVDGGIGEKRIDLVYLVLASQLFLFLGSTGIELFQNWLLLHVNTRISLSIISDFLKKLFQLPIRFFDAKSIGDITQRISDHHRVEQFLTSTALTTFISVINVLIFSLVLAFYSVKILLVFTVMSLAAVGWVLLFQHKRKEIDYRRFNTNRENQDKLYQIIIGMPDIKLYGGEKNKRHDWERLQLKLFRLNIHSLSLEQIQRTGFVFLLQLKNIIISFIAASEVVRGNYSLGAMLSIAYIIGQTNSPLEQLISFFRIAQDARLSMDRMKEIHNRENEEQVVNPVPAQTTADAFIRFNHVFFQYSGPKSRFVLDDIHHDIAIGKINAIVGDSGSGKTTLMKLLLKFYDCTRGHISIGGADLKDLSARSWRECCGTVMQDGHIFSDSILRNIALDGGKIDKKRLAEALYISNMDDFINSMPNGLHTRIGANGSGISGGQKQRLLIARAVYKNPDFIFFDEATSALDANNEKIIMERLYSFFKNRTVVIIAHRLSTVKNADMTMVMQNGKIVETGTHETLLHNKGYYFELVRNQLELGAYEY